MKTPNDIRTVAVIGGGVTGIVAAYLLDRKYKVTLFEKNDYLGGHTNTQMVAAGPDRQIPVDTGFIVFNDRTYPHFTTFLKQLKVAAADAPMSFGYYNRAKDVQFCSRVPGGVFADRKNLVRPWYWRMIGEILRFNRQARRDLAGGRLGDMTLGQYLSANRYSAAFQDYYLLPMAGAIWSSPAGQITRFPCESFFRFYDNHGLLSTTDHPQWKTICNGSVQYVRAFEKVFTGQVRLKAAISHVARTAEGVAVITADGHREVFDAAVIAAHADQALTMLEDPDDTEKTVLGAWTYSRNTTVLHTDRSLMPPLTRAWAAWNYMDDGTPASRVALTYYMNLLQGLPGGTDFFVTLNAPWPINSDTIAYQVLYEHPIYDTAALRSQKHLPLMRPERNTFFCGSYCGYGFHEDGTRAAVDVARHLGVEL
ncbi:MAG: NAD(P)/FAD-dependent oxidoreductase [Thermodesulfobacteriota bacterium]